MRYVYLLKNLVNDKVYVGQTYNVNHRLAGHFSAAKSGNFRPLYRSIRKHGEANFSIEILEECDDSIADEREKFWISHYDSYNHEKGYNLTKGGAGASDQTRDKLSGLFSGERNPMFGQTSAMKGKKHTEISKKKMREAQARINLRTEIVAKRSLSGEKNGMFGRRGEKCPVAKLTQAQADEIRGRLKTEKISFHKLGREYGVSRFTISRINDGVIYVSV